MNWKHPTNFKIRPLRDGILVALVLFTTGCIGIAWIYRYASQDALLDVRNNLQIVAQLAASQVDGELHQTLISPDQMGSEAHKKALAPLVQLHRAIPAISYIYTAVLRDDGIHFILDTTTEAASLKLNRPVKPSKIMEFYSNSDPEMLSALQEGRPYTNNRLWKDNFGVFISGYAPFYAQGKLAGIAGVDLAANELAERLSTLRFATGSGAAIVLAISILLGEVARRSRKNLAAMENTMLERSLELLIKNSQLSEEITERKQAQKALTESEARFKQVAEIAEEWIWEIDSDGLFKYSSAAIETILGYRTEEVVGKKHFYDLLNPCSQEKVKQVCFASFARKEIIKRFTNVHVHKNGRLIMIETSGFPVLDHAGNLIGYRGANINITRRKEVEEQLHRAKNAAEAADRAKSNFLATVSHEVRTPLNGIIGMTGILLDTPLNQQQTECVDIVRRSGDLLLTIINDILDFSKIEAGKLVLDVYDFDLLDTVEGTVELLAETAHAKGIDLFCFVERDVNLAVRGDAGRLQQILTNLVGNAIKFTTKGAVTVSVSSQETTDSTLLARFEITDTGIGISEEAQTRVFQAFDQADSSTTRQYGGTGLGLAISAQLAALMHGEIGVKSTLGQGSTFWFTVKMELQPKRRLLSDISRNTPPLRVLIANDNPLAQQAILRTALGWQMDCTIASTAEEAMSLLLEAVSGNPYDAAVLDLHTPEFHSLSLAKAIRSEPLIAHTHLIVVESIQTHFDESALVALGIDGHILKPVHQSRFFDSVTRAVNFPKSRKVLPEIHSSPQSYSFHHPSIPKPRILLAEDNAFNQKVTFAQLHKMGLNADAVANGLEALQALSHIPYDIILMDCEMPEMNGLEAALQIRTRYQTRPVYIIALTANAIRDNQKECLASGMNDYLNKPVQIHDLGQALYRGAAWLAAHPHRASNAEPTLDTKTLEGLQKLVRQNIGITAAEISDSFQKEAAAAIDALKSAIAEKNSAQLKASAHLIRGICLNMGAMAMASTGNRIEDYAECAGFPEAERAIHQLETEFEQVRKELAAQFHD